MSASFPRIKIGVGTKCTEIPPSGSYSGGHWYQQIVILNEVTAADEDVYSVAKIGWRTAVAKTIERKRKKKQLAYVVFCASPIPCQAWIHDTSLRGSWWHKQSAQSCDIVKGDHKTFANCAETSALFIMRNNSWSIPPKGANLACEGSRERKRNGLIHAVRA